MSWLVQFVQSLRARAAATRVSRRRSAKPNARHFRPALLGLESRWVPSGAGVSLGTAANYAVLGLQSTQITNTNVTITGDEGVSAGGKLSTVAPSTITGNAIEATAGQYSGRGQLGASLVIDPNALSQANTDALSASSAAAALAPTQTFGSIGSPTTVTGNGGLNVIAVNGDIASSLILSGSSKDVFIVNVTGSVKLNGSETLSLAGGVTADHVLYNFTGASGSIATHAGNVLNGTLLAPTYSFSLGGTCNGEIIGGGKSISLLAGAHVNAVAFAPPAPATQSLSGTVTDQNGAPLSGETFTLTNTTTGQQFVVQSDGYGNFTFSGVPAGSYTLVETITPTKFGTPQGVSATAGTDGGTAVSPTEIDGITLNVGDSAANYNFVINTTIIG
jgi:hypothetical protein